MNKIWPVCIRAFFAGWFSLVDWFLFDKHHWRGDVPKHNGPVLLIANHSSWWDGIWIWQRNRSHWQLQFRVPMLQQSLQRWPFLKHLGGMPLARGKVLAAQSAEVAQACSKLGQLLLLFPEGQIRRALPGQHHFQEGLLKKMLLQPQLGLVFTYQVVVSTNKPKPEVYHFLKGVPLGTVAELQQQYAAFAAECERQIDGGLRQQMDRL